MAISNELTKLDNNQQRLVTGTSLVAQWLRLYAPTAVGAGLIPGRGLRSHMSPRGSRKKREKKKKAANMTK